MIARIIGVGALILPVLIAATPANGAYAEAIVDFQPGNPIWAQAPIDQLLGAPDTGMNWNDVQGSIGHLGQVTLDMGPDGVQDIAGDDLKFWLGGFYSSEIEVVEGFTVEISANGSIFYFVGELLKELTISGPVPLFSRDLDIASSGLTSARYVRVTDTGTDEQFSGLELNAVEAVPEPGTLLLLGAGALALLRKRG